MKNKNASLVFRIILLKTFSEIEKENSQGENG